MTECNEQPVLNWLQFAHIADSVLEDRQVQASRTAPISAIPVRQPEPARKGAGRRVGLARRRGRFTDRCHTSSELRVCGLQLNFAPYSPRSLPAKVDSARHQACPLPRHT